jgi:hypothetical protein
MCPHTAINVSSYCYVCPHTAVCVLILLYMSSYCYVCVLILPYMCPHTAIYVSSYCNICVLIFLHQYTGMYVSSYSYATHVYVSLILLCYWLLTCFTSCRHVSSYSYASTHGSTTITEEKKFRVPRTLLCLCPHTAIYVSSYCCACVLILLYMCPHTRICVLILVLSQWAAARGPHGRGGVGPISCSFAAGVDRRGARYRGPRRGAATE